MTRSVAHETFVLERSYPARPDQVFNAFVDPALKRKWFVEGEGWNVLGFEMDFRVQGRESSRFRFGDGPEVRNDTVYQDIVDGERIVFAYVMTVDGTRISASLASVEIRADGAGSHLTYTEQAAFFDGADSAASRMHGCGELFDRLGELLGAGVAT